jgi:hypothetical protein
MRYSINKKSYWIYNKSNKEILMSDLSNNEYIYNLISYKNNNIYILLLNNRYKIIVDFDDVYSFYKLSENKRTIFIKTIVKDIIKEIDKM